MQGNRTSGGRKWTRATWDDNVIMADFGARRRQEDGQRVAKTPKAAEPVEGWASGVILEALAQRADSGRISRGREYYQQGRAQDLDLEKDVVHGYVQGTQPEPFIVTLKVAPITQKRCDFLAAELADDPAIVRTIQSGGMPPVDTASMLLRTDQVRIPSCTCPDPVPVCKHAIAVAYAIAEYFNEDPLRVLRWRGVSTAEAVEKLKRIDQARGPQQADYHSDGSGGASRTVGASAKEGELVDAESFWGRADSYVSWEEFSQECGMDLPGRDMLVKAMGTVTWTSVDQLATMHDLELAYEQFLEFGDPEVALPWAD